MIKPIPIFFIFISTALIRVLNILLSLRTYYNRDCRERNGRKFYYGKRNDEKS